ncbi:MAG: acyltransferase [Rhizobiaceae bacterium]|nr:acyltransferase [Rhizobiaceae bacterium]
MSFTTSQIATIAVVFALAIGAASLSRLLLPNRQTGRSRDRILEGLRGVAAVGVVACHLNQHMVAILGFTEPPLLGNHVGILGVQMFFALTAYLFTRKALAGEIEAGEFYIGRIRRIVPLYTFVCLAGFAIAWFYTRQQTFPLGAMLSDAMNTYLYGFAKNDPIEFRGINMLTLIGIAWTLSYEWIFYILLIPAFSLWRQRGLWRWSLSGVVVVLACRDFMLQSEQIIWPFFLPGVAAALLEEKMPRRIGLLALCLTPIAIWLVFWLPGFWNPTKLLMASIVFFGILFGRPRWLEGRLLQVLGASSFSIYLLQYLVIFVAARVTYGTIGQTTVNRAIAIGSISVVLIVLLAALSYRFIEQRWMTPRSPSPAPAPIPAPGLTAARG